MRGNGFGMGGGSAGAALPAATTPVAPVKRPPSRVPAAERVPHFLRDLPHWRLEKGKR